MEIIVGKEYYSDYSKYKVYAIVENTVILTRYWGIVDGQPTWTEPFIALQKETVLERYKETSQEAEKDFLECQINHTTKELLNLAEKLADYNKRLNNLKSDV